MKTHPQLILTVLMLLLTTPACEMETRVIRSSWDSLPADPKPRHTPTDQRSNPYQNTAPGQSWAIQVTQISGNTRHDQARELVQQLRTKTSLTDFWIEDLNNTATVYHSRFQKASDPAIRKALAAVQNIELNGTRPFTDSKLVPLVGQGRTIADPYDLRQFIGYYSLQIGFYDQAFGQDFRQAAEQAVHILREEGYDAYYYHGPFRSIIAIGVFSYQQAFVTVGTTDTYAPHIRQLQKAFPYNLGNGATIIQKEGGRNIGEQKSSLIRIF
jgi:hypothetical protein